MQPEKKPQTYAEYAGFYSEEMQRRAKEAGCRNTAEIMDWLDRNYGKDQNGNIHPLKGNYQGFWSVTVRANWRIIFRFEGETVFDVELIDYH
jgi:toxin HigB-1